MKKSEFFGIHFVPLNVPLKDRLEALSTVALFMLFPGLLPIGICSTLYLLFYTKYWPLVIFYYIWILVFDREVIEAGNRRSDWVLSWSVFKYARNYYPVSSIRVPEFQPDSTKNYLAGVFPHAIVPYGSVIEGMSNAGGRKLFPNHVVHPTTLRYFFYVPLLREFLISLGFIVASAQCISRLLNFPGGGKVVAITVGGGSEMMYACGGQYHLILKNRKGFIRLALINGTPVFPAFTFGETGIFNINAVTSSSFYGRLQSFTKKILGFPIIIPHGRGFFQYDFGVIPLQKPITVVVGLPLEVPKIENPSKKVVDDFHSRYIARLTELFEKYKYHYEKDPENCRLIIS